MTDHPVFQSDSRYRTSLSHWTVLFIYVLVTLLMTYPLILRMGNTVLSDLGDPLLNTWILAWDVKKFMAFDFLRIFDANIFYPSRTALAYSEHLFGSAVFALPVMAAWKNPILTYNVIYLSGMILSGFGAYLLALHLTKNRAAAFCAGLIFSCFPFRFGHMSHVQMQTAEWIPLTLLCLHKMVERPNLKYSFLFALCFLLQFLSCGYYGVYLAFSVALFVVFKTFGNKLSIKFYRGLLLSLLCAGVVLIPCMLPYLRLKHQFGFTRSMAENIWYSPDLLSYLSAPGVNRLYGRISQPFGKAEGELFLGIIPMLLALIGIGKLRFSPCTPEAAKRSVVGRTMPIERFSPYLKILSTAVFLFYLLVLCAILVTGGVSFPFLGRTIHMVGIEKPFAFLLCAGAVRCLFQKRLRAAVKTALAGMQKATDRQFYFILLVASFLCSLGPIIHVKGHKIIVGPYVLLYKYFPGFDGLRVPGRFTIIVALCTGIFAAYGIARLQAKMTGYKKKLLVPLLSVAILVEFASIPVPLASIAVGSDVPEVYRWLNRQEGKRVVLELPMAHEGTLMWKEEKRVYFSIYHWNSLVNGFSGYAPPYYMPLARQMSREFPSSSTVNTLKDIGVDYIVVHASEYDPENWKSLRTGMARFRDLEFTNEFGSDYVFQLKKP